MAYSNNKDTCSKKSGPEPAIDEESVKRRFGWFQLQLYTVPHIFRGTEKYCALRMLQVTLLQDYDQELTEYIYTCKCVRTYKITQAESNLLNEINIEHSDYMYGDREFSTDDLIISVNDASNRNLHDFIRSYYQKRAAL